MKYVLYVFILSSVSDYLKFDFRFLLLFKEIYMNTFCRRNTLLSFHRKRKTTIILEGFQVSDFQYVKCLQANLVNVWASPHFHQTKWFVKKIHHPQNLFDVSVHILFKITHTLRDMLNALSLATMDTSTKYFLYSLCT